MPEKRKEMPSALRSIIAGSTAGAVEIGEFPNLGAWGQRAVLCCANVRVSYYVSSGMYV